MGKLKRNELVPYLVDKMLEPYGVTYNYVMENPIIDGKPWYQYYTFNSQQEVDDFKKFFIFTLTQSTTPKFRKRTAEVEYEWFNLKCGLKENFKNVKELQEEQNK